MDALDFPKAMLAALGLLREVDGFINDTEPFKRAKDETKLPEVGAILYQCAEAVRIASLMLWAALPVKMPELWAAMGLEVDPDAGGFHDLVKWGGLEPGRNVAKVALFPRIENALDS